MHKAIPALVLVSLLVAAALLGALKLGAGEGTA